MKHVVITTHVRRAPAEPKLICVKCDRWFRGRKRLAKHVISKHGDGK